MFENWLMKIAYSIYHLYDNHNHSSKSVVTEKKIYSYIIIPKQISS